ncbi:hypothetical protein PHYPSEUDO_008027 [Phytophthora pseudosyringae]|uniref:PX domain-containing protein n=1 Tax=Phytophthora pseudosyringae TaxID=221518 RepID=A0A8T1VFG3_9STRA|nr:hypothetical protein PHYPSEUDO_008027 [Phytophthora pseudosyringae]
MADASSAERREQLRSLNDSLLSGSLSRQEYDELLPFLASPAAAQQPQPQEDSAFAAALAQAQHQPSDPPASDHHSSSPRNVHFAVAPEPIAAPPQYQILAPVAAASASSGLQLRCPACGTSNDTARGPRCYVCSSRLTIADELSAAVAARSFGRGAGSRQRWPVVNATALPSGAFSAAGDGRVVIHDGIFTCAMHDTQVIATAEGSACQVFVLCCTWQARSVDQQPPATWFVSQRFSQFERLHKALKRRLSRSTTVSLPPFPAKYHLTDRLEKRKQGLGAYMPRLLEMCAQLPNAQPVPELDEFLDVSHQVQNVRSQRPSAAAPPVVTASPPVDGSQRSAAPTSTTATTSVSSPFPAFAGPAMAPSQRVAPPMDETELAQAEGAVRLLAQAVRNARGDVRGDGTIQHHLDVCVQLAPGLQRSADLDNPFANAELVPRAMQCQEDLQQAVAMYNDALLAASGIAPAQQQVQTQQHAQQLQQSEPHVQAQQMPVRNVVPASAA